jgi:TonB family protein
MIPFVLSLAQIVITGPPTGWVAPPNYPRYIFSSEDYPAEAVKNHWEGTVVVDVLVSADGSPKSCSIIDSSGHKLLDDTTCDLIMSRAKFGAAKDKAGNVIESHFRPPSISWHLKK